MVVWTLAMKILRDGKLVFALYVIFAFSGSLYAQESSCNEIPAVAYMASARSSVSLRAQKQKAGNSYRAQLVYSARMLEINPQDESAAKLLLDLLPKRYDDPHQWY